ncbi:MAG: arginine--tRNA ligase [Candidatus Accumulibacter sp.]|jgi:arginyl-tRNA synthetase|nr:arginine--tRNA ligase [Accumulibacter sp.]
MSHDIKDHLSGLTRAALESVLPEHRNAAVLFEKPKRPSNGDFSCNLAMRLARLLKRDPSELARLLVSALPESPFVDKAETAGGFINFYLRPLARIEAVRTVLAQKNDFGRSGLGGGRKLQIEFVSANPTGPLHVGHGRGAAYGASLSSLMAFAGWDVTREYYVNDAGRQMDILALSAWLRYLALFGDSGADIPFPPNAYQGGYVIDMAKQLQAEHGHEFCRPAPGLLMDIPSLPAPERVDDEAKEMRETRLDALIERARTLLGDGWRIIHNHVLTAQLAECRNDLEEFGVFHDVWFPEQALYDTGLVARCVERLENAGHIYVRDGAKWFRSTAFGDEKDRVVQRDNGMYTYFASDIAYHLNKFERGFDRIINIWGADHHGYIPRVKGAVAALGLDTKKLEIALVQFAVLYREGKKVSMSTRSAEFVTLRALREEAGNDACRFFYVLRKSDQHLDFDLDLARSQTNENPVYYIQYAHARLCSMLAQWAREGGDPASLDSADLSRLDNPRELALASRLGEFPDIIESAARELAPHMLAFYLKDLAADFHSYYNAERVLVDDKALKTARIALVTAMRQVIRTGLKLLGVGCPESM